MYGSKIWLFGKFLGDIGLMRLADVLAILFLKV